MPGARLPARATPGSAALDVHSCLAPDTIMLIPPGERAAVPTGLFFEIPEGYMFSIRPRSGLAFREGLTLPNAPGTIDADYRGELKVLIQNLGRDPIHINHGDRVAQMLLEKVLEFDWDEVDEPIDPESTPRGEGGFGSTGLA